MALATLCVAGVLSAFSAVVSGGCYVLVQCCNLSDNLDNLDADTRFRKEICTEISSGMHTGSDSVLSCTLMELTFEGHDVVGALTAEKVGEPDAWFVERKVMPILPFIRAHRIIERPRKPLAKFAAACVVELRSKFGVLSSTSANHMLIQKCYLKLCRDHHVRQTDVALHRQVVLNHFFSETDDIGFAFARYNAPRWLKWIRGELTPSSNPLTVC
jgi:hypothetical protein